MVLPHRFTDRPTCNPTEAVDGKLSGDLFVVLSPS